MRFWQAVVTAQMAAGAVWADRFIGHWWAHLAADAGSIAFGALLWLTWKTLFPTTNIHDVAQSGGEGGKQNGKA